MDTAGKSTMKLGDLLRSYPAGVVLARVISAVQCDHSTWAVEVDGGFSLSARELLRHLEPADLDVEVTEVGDIILAGGEPILARAAPDLPGDRGGLPRDFDILL